MRIIPDKNHNVEFEDMDSCKKSNEHCCEGDNDEYLSTTSNEDLYTSMDEAECKHEYFDANDNFEKNHKENGMHESYSSISHSGNDKDQSRDKKIKLAKQTTSRKRQGTTAKSRHRISKRTIEYGNSLTNPKHIREN